MSFVSTERSPSAKLALALFVGFLLSFPLFTVWLLTNDRQQQSEFAQASIAEGWGGPQTLAGPLLVIPYRETTTETVMEGTRQVTRSRETWQELSLSPEQSSLQTSMRPERRSRSIYEVVVYEATTRGRARFAFPPDISRFGVAAEDMDLSRAELRFGLSDPRGLVGNPQVIVGGRALRLQPGGGGAPGFFAWVDAAALANGTILVDYGFHFRGNQALGLAPQAGETRWRLSSTWPHPSFQGGFLPVARQIGRDGFVATYRVGNLALGASLVKLGGASATVPAPNTATERHQGEAVPPLQGGGVAQVNLVQPVDLYSRVDRSAKYGFLFIGFTFLAFLMFDIIGGVRVSPVEYLLVGAGLVLFFVLLLAFAEVIGFAPAYVVASAAIAGLNTAYSAAVLKSWRRAGFIGALLIGLYALLFVLLSLEDLSLVIGSVMLFVALATVMYLTRNINWVERPAGPEPSAT